MKSRWSRRQFLKNHHHCRPYSARENSWGATKRIHCEWPRLGKTSRCFLHLPFFSGARFCSIETKTTAQALCRKPFSTFGINYFRQPEKKNRRSLHTPSMSA